MADLGAAEEGVVQVGRVKDFHAIIFQVGVVALGNDDRLHGDLADIIRCVAQEQTLLDAVEGDGFRCADGLFAQQLAGGAVDAGGDVNCDDGRTEIIAVICPVNERTCIAVHRAGQTRAEKRIHDHVAQGKLFELSRVLKRNLQHFRQVPVQPRISVHVRRDFDNMSLAAPLRPQPRCCIAISAVVARPAQEHNSTLVCVSGDGVANAHGGMLHQQRAGDGVFFHKAAFERLHISGGDREFHQAVLRTNLCTSYYTSFVPDCKP